MSKFALGTVAMTQGIRGLFDEGFDPLPYFVRHAQGDWANLTEYDRNANEFAIGKYLRIISWYDTDFGRIQIVTEADRSSTTMLLPSEY